MKTTKLIFVTVLFLALLYTDAFPQWQFQNPKGTPYDIKCCSFINTQTGWTGGERSGYITRTNDGGKTWKTLGKIGVDVNDIKFINAQTGFIEVIRDSLIYKTTDGGSNWFILTQNPAKISSFYAYNENQLWIGDQLGNIRYTTNAGTEWLVSNVTTTNINQIIFTNINTGYCLSAAGVVYKSSDKGATWTLIYDAGMPISQMYFKNTNHGWLTMANKIVLTNNGGGLWEDVTPGFNPLYISFGNNYDGWVIDDQKNVYRSEDGGYTYLQQSLPFDTLNVNTQYYGIAAVNTDVGYIYGNDGNVYKTNDAGAEWLNVTNIFSGTFSSIHFANNNTGWVCGENGALFKTTNNGTDWKKLNPGISNHLYTIRAISSSNLFAGGTGGTLLKSINGGNNWTIQTMPDISTIQSIFFLNNNTGWLGGDSVLYKTTNRGTNWVFQAKLPYIKNIFFINSLTGFIGGNGIYKTTDGGNNWVKKGTSNLVIYGVYMIENKGFIVGRQYSLAKTTDYGETWGSPNLLNEDKSPPGINTSVWMNDTAATWFTLSHSFEGRVNRVENSSNELYVKRKSFYSVFGIKNQSLWACGEKGVIVSAKIQNIITGNENNVSEIPTNYILKQNYPNPFNPVTKIDFAIPKQGLVTLKIYDILGREIKTLVNEFKSIGNYSIDFNASALSSGVYFYRLQAGDFVQTKSMMVIK